MQIINLIIIQSHSTSFSVLVNGNAEFAKIDKERIDTLPDSVSLACTDEYLGGTKFCGLDRTLTILN